MSKSVRAGPMTMKRINRELADLSKEDMGSMTLAPIENNLFEWKATIPGPQGSVYEGGVFHVDISLPSDYPFSAPKTVFTTRIYHMNISERGQVCVDLLKYNWSPALSLFKVMLSLSSLLTDPNPKDPLVPSIATQYTRQRALHDSTARHWTQLYATPKPRPVPPAITEAIIPLPSTSTIDSARLRHTVPTPTVRSTEVISIPDTPPRQRARSSRRAAPSIPIDISDDDAPVNRKRKSNDDGGASSQHRYKRRNGENSGRDVIVIDD